MLYLAVKALHIVAAIVWVGALFVLTFVSSRQALDQSQLKHARRITDAGIGFTWLAGITLAVLGGWYLATWWQIKLVLVVLLSAIHSIVHRRWQSETQKGELLNPMLPWLLLALTLLIVALAVFKTI